MTLKGLRALYSLNIFQNIPIIRRQDSQFYFFNIRSLLAFIEQK